jgi:hypothetical protein
MSAQRITRTGPAQWLRESLFETAIDALIHAREQPKFVF